MTGVVDTLPGFGIKATFGYVLNHISLSLRQLSMTYHQLARVTPIYTLLLDRIGHP